MASQEPNRKVRNWHSHYGKQHGGSSENSEQSYHMTQQSLCWVSTQKLEGIYSQRHTHPYVHCSIFTAAKAWKPPEGPSVDDWIKTTWETHTMGHSSARG